MIVRLLLWNLADSMTTLDELRAQLPDDEHRTWISDENTERFGVIETWDDVAGEFPPGDPGPDRQGPRDR